LRFLYGVWSSIGLEVHDSNMSVLAKAPQWLANELGLATMRRAGSDVYILILARYIRLVAYGAVALILALYFRELGFTDSQIGLFMTLTLLGDVFISLLLTLIADSIGRRTILLGGAIAMATSGAVFATTSNYVALLSAAIIGVISPSGNEIGPFRAVEESTLAHLVEEGERSDVYTWYVVRNLNQASGVREMLIVLLRSWLFLVPRRVW
jgi:MFS family permease